MKELHHHHHHSLFSCSSEHQRSSLLHCKRFWIHANTSYPIINPHCAIRKELNALTGCCVLNITADLTAELYMCITDTWAAGGASPAVCDGSGQNKVHLVVLSIAVCATLTVQLISEYMKRCFKKQMFVFFLFLQSSRWKMWFWKKVFEPRVDFSIQPAESSAFFGVCSTVWVTRVCVSFQDGTEDSQPGSQMSR